MKHKLILLSFAIAIFFIGFTSAKIVVQDSDKPNILITHEATANRSLDNVNNSDFWDGLDTPANINHNTLGSKQGGQTGEYYHLNLSIYNQLLAYAYLWITSSSVNSSWNQSFADTIYAAIRWGYNHTIISNSYTDTQTSNLNLSLETRKLNVTDQRYNETNLVNNLNLSIEERKLNATDQRYNDTTLFNNLNSSKLDLTDQRFNETTYITNVNQSLIVSKLNISDQRYNETGWINIQNFITSLIGNNTYAGIIWGYNHTTLAVNDVNARFWNRSQSYNKTEIDNNLSSQNFITSIIGNNTYQLIGNYITSLLGNQTYRKLSDTINAANISDPINLANETNLHISNITNFLYNYNTTTPAMIEAGGKVNKSGDVLTGNLSVRSINVTENIYFRPGGKIMPWGTDPQTINFADATGFNWAVFSNAVRTMTISTGDEIALAIDKTASGKAGLTVSGGYIYLLGGAFGLGTGDNNDFTLRANAIEKMRVKTTGVIQMNDYGAGTATFDASGNIASVSDERLKDIEGNYMRGLTEALQIEPIVFKWNNLSGLETNHTYAGFSAQNINKSIPEAVKQNSAGYYSVDDRAIIATLVNAIKEQQTKIEELENRLNVLEAGNNAITLRPYYYSENSDCPRVQFVKVLEGKA